MIERSTEHLGSEDMIKGSRLLSKQQTISRDVEAEGAKLEEK